MFGNWLLSMLLVSSCSTNKYAVGRRPGDPACRNNSGSAIRTNPGQAGSAAGIARRNRSSARWLRRRPAN